LDEVKFSTEDIKAKDTNITTMVIKMPSWKPWFMRPSGLIVRGRKKREL
jgi:hypothetical protein